MTYLILVILLVMLGVASYNVIYPDSQLIRSHDLMLGALALRTIRRAFK